MLASDEGLKEALIASYRSLEAFCRIMHPEIFSIPFSNLHRTIIKHIESTASNKKLILAPRGIGKTSLVCAYIEKKILFRESHFVLYVSNSEQLAVMQTENLKFALKSPSIKSIFGDVEIGDSSIDFDNTFSKKVWTAFGECLVLPRGCLQQIRGAKWRQYRPDLIIFDDLESREDVQSEHNREKIRQWFYSDAIYVAGKQPEYIYIDTLKHEQALPNYLKRSGEWNVVELEICDDQLQSNAPEFVSNEQIKKEYDEAVATGTLEQWYMERRNKPVAEETRKFKSSYFQYYTQEMLDECPDLETIILADPARVVKSTSDYTAIVGVGISREKNRIFVMDVVEDRMLPDQFYEELFSMAQRLEARVIGVEDTGLGEYVTYPIQNELVKRGLPYILVPMHAGIKKKEDRIGSLLPYYRTGVIWHNKNACIRLEEQLLSYPRGAHDDIIDALAYVSKILQEGERFFLPKEMSDHPMFSELALNWEII